MDFVDKNEFYVVSSYVLTFEMFFFFPTPKLCDSRAKKSSVLFAIGCSIRCKKSFIVNFVLQGRNQRASVRVCGRRTEGQKSQACVGVVSS